MQDVFLPRRIGRSTYMLTGFGSNSSDFNPPPTTHSVRGWLRMVNNLCLVYIKKYREIGTGTIWTPARPLTFFPFHVFIHNLFFAFSSCLSSSQSLILPSHLILLLRNRSKYFERILAKFLKQVMSNTQLLKVYLLFIQLSQQPTSLFVGAICYCYKSRINPYELFFSFTYQVILIEIILDKEQTTKVVFTRNLA